MQKLSVDVLSSLFNFLENQDNCVFWIRSRHYERQLFVSANFESIWGYPSHWLFQYPDQFKNSLVPEDRDVLREQRQLDEENHEHITYYYRIQTPNGDRKHIKDWHYLLTNEQDVILGVAGLAQVISTEQWASEQNQSSIEDLKSPLTMLKHTIFGILKNELHLRVRNINQFESSKSLLTVLNTQGESIDLTTREVDVLNHLLMGKSAKQTAALLHISQRTVEFHLKNIKNKANCRTKLELLGRVKSKHLTTS